MQVLTEYTEVGGFFIQCLCHFHMMYAVRFLSYHKNLSKCSWGKKKPQQEWNTTDESQLC